MDSYWAHTLCVLWSCSSLLEDTKVSEINSLNLKPKGDNAFL